MRYNARNYVELKLNEVEEKIDGILNSHGFKKDEVMRAYWALTGLLPVCQSDLRYLEALNALHTKLDSVIAILEHKGDGHE